MATKSESSLTMNKDLAETFALVKGTFTVDEAREVLMALIESKVTFHSRKKLRSFEQSGEADPKSEKKIAELENMRKEVLELISHAKKNDQQLQINSELNITLVENSAPE